MGSEESQSQAARRSARKAVFVFLVAMLGDVGFRIYREQFDGRWESALPILGGILAVTFLLVGGVAERREARTRLPGMSPEDRRAYHLQVQRRLRLASRLVGIGAILILVMDLGRLFLP